MLLHLQEAYSRVNANTGYLVTEIIVFLLIQKALEKFERSDISLAPLARIQLDLSGSALCGACCLELKLVHTDDGSVEALLSLVLTLIFIQAIPVFTLTRKNYHLKHEEIICLIILLASVMTGTVVGLLVLSP